MKKIFSLFSVLCLLSSTSLTEAALVLDLRLTDGSRSSTVVSGSSVLVDMFLVDTDGTSPMTAGGGLSSGGGKLLAAATGAGAATGSFSAPGVPFAGGLLPPISPVAGLDAPGIASFQVTAPLFGALISAPGAGVTTLATIGATEVHLATLSVTATGNDGDIVTLTGARLGTVGGGIPFNGNTAFPGAPPLDSLPIFINSGPTESVELSIAAVPEPSSILAASLLLGGAFICVRRRRAVQA